jgi:hypothetical protein
MSCVVLDARPALPIPQGLSLTCGDDSGVRGRDVA